MTGSRINHLARALESQGGKGFFLDTLTFEQGFGPGRI